MKKSSKLMRASGVLLLLTLITSCFAGGTFAKYVSTGEGQDVARVAKWGVNVSVIGGGFHTQYGKDNVNNNIKGSAVLGNGSEEITFTWKADTGEENQSQTENVSNVIAPGTKGTFGGVKITGTPEVAVKVKTDAEVVLTGWNIKENGDEKEFYCPLVFTVGEKTICGLHYSQDTAGGQNSFETALETAIEKATSGEFEAGTDLTTVGKDITYSWAWPFENGNHFKKDGNRESCDTENVEGGTSYHVCDQDDTLDTLLGNNATGEDDSQIPGILIKVTTTVTQID